MQAKSDWLLVKHFKPERKKTELITPTGEHEYFMEVASVGDKVENAKVGDIILPSSMLGWHQIKGEKYHLLKDSQVGAVADPDDI